MKSIFYAGLVAALVAGPAAAQQAQQGHASQHGAGHAQHGAAGAQAHGVVTSPADGAMTQGSPEWFTATFQHPMRLTAVTVSSEGSEPRNVAIAASAATTRVTARLPRLAAGNHRLSWTAEGADGHRMTGSVRFMVH